MSECSRPSGLADETQIGQQPWLDRYLLHKNPVKMFLMQNLPSAANGDTPVTHFARHRMQERREKLSAPLKSFDADAGIERGQGGVDFLTRFTMAQKDHPDFMTDDRILTACTSLVNAGSDTTAISLSAVFYFLMRNREAYGKLMQELETAIAEGMVSAERECISWAEARRLPYLDAVINESFRLFPAVGLLLERHVPREGAKICGEWIPGGTIVGCSAWVLHRREDVFGEEVERFRPERWIMASPKERSQMESVMFQFGAGSRTCIGRHISTMEVYKLVPTLLRKFEVRRSRNEGLSAWN